MRISTSITGISASQHQRQQKRDETQHHKSTVDVTKSSNAAEGQVVLKDVRK
jgi:hypothetical protein